MALLMWRFLAGLAFVLGVTLAATDEEKENMKKALDSIMKDCRKEFQVTMEDMRAVKMSGDLGKTDPCFIDCTFKKMGVLNEAGVFDVEAAKKASRSFFKGEEDAQKSDQVVDKCSSVNTEMVDGGAKACERARLLMSCFMKEHSIATIDQLNEDFTGVLLECVAENPITPFELEYMMNKKMPDSTAAKCLFACAYKKTGMMDAEGKLSVEGLTELSKKYFSDDPKKLKASDDFNKLCLSVNDEPVGDGSKGCDRAALIFSCSVENVPAFDFMTS